jgi:hypothetical protein
MLCRILSLLGRAGDELNSTRIVTTLRVAARHRLENSFAAAATLVIALVLCPVGLSQTAATGALTGTVTDPGGARIADADVSVTNEATGEVRAATTGADGTFRVPLLPPGNYSLEAKRSGFKLAKRTGISVNVTEVATVPVELEIGSVTQSVTVSGEGPLIQSEDSSLGKVTDEQMVQELPLVNRNFTQILALSTGVASDVTDASTLGRGIRNVMFVGSARSFDNDYQMNGVDVNDYNSGSSGLQTGAFPVPTPDAIQEFKVITSQADASYGFDAGAHVNIVTKSGSNQFHGNAFEYFRNDKLNANNFFNNLTGQPRGELRQNQFGYTLGGPIKKDKLLFFTSYQGTRQRNGVGPTSTASVVGPPLTNDRSAAALGQLFGGQAGVNGGVAVAPDGSNINPVALQLLNLKLPDGTYYIKTPQIITGGQGFSSFSAPGQFREDQFLANLDYLQSSRSSFSVRFFYSDGQQLDPFATRSSSNVPGSPMLTNPHYRDISLGHTYAFNSNWVNDARFGFSRVENVKSSQAPFTQSGVGMTVPDQMSFDKLPLITIAGSYVLGPTFPLKYAQNTFDLRDTVSFSKGKHSFRFGGELMRNQNYFLNFTFNTFYTFLGFPDFLLGASAAQNGSSYSNVFNSTILGGNLDRYWQAWNPSLWIQDDFKVSSNLTLNLGLRYEHQGPPVDKQQINTNFWPSLADPNPPAGGTLAGYVVPNGFPGSLPAGVFRSPNGAPVAYTGDNTLGPRVGFAYRLPQTEHVVLRGGYGIYYSRVVGNVYLQLISNPPYSLEVSSSGTANAAATFQNPFPGVSFNFPSFPAYSPTTSLSFSMLDPNLRPGINQQFSFNVQVESPRNFLWEIGYVGARSSHVQNTMAYNEALLASPTQPIRGQTTNTLANLPLRVPLLGFAPGGQSQVCTCGVANYDSLQASVTKRIGGGLTFLASYTFSKSYDNTFGEGTAVGTEFGGNLLGSRYSPGQGYGVSDFNRKNRFILSFAYQFPKFSKIKELTQVLSNWSTAGVVTFQSGLPITVTDSRAGSIFGLSNELAQFAPSCKASLAETPGSVTSKLNNYLNASCFTTPPNLSSDLTPAYGFGNSGRGVAYGPDQRNFDLELSKLIPIRESLSLEFRGEFFNAFNTPQFQNPNSALGTSSFGFVTATSVAPRIVQLALKLNF